MTIKEKNGFSHRANAFNKFAEWYKTLQYPRSFVIRLTRTSSLTIGFEQLSQLVFLHLTQHGFNRENQQFLATH